MYDKNISATIFQRFSHSSRFKLSKKIFLMTTKDGDNILDFGTGDGKVFEYYLEEKSLKMFYGYDISSSMLKEVLPELIDKVNFTNDIKDICHTAPAKAEGGRAYYDNSDAMIDYFDTAFYVHINVGKWNKPYVLKAA